MKTFVVIAVCSMATVGCRNNTEKIEYILPNDFRGEARVYTNRPDGIVLPIVDGVYVVRFDPNGTLSIKDDGPFSEWHTDITVYESGSIIPSVYNSVSIKSEPQRVAVRAKGYAASGFHYLVIGTADDCNRWREKLGK